ncbi:hypothetical protein ACH4ND_03705 [Streptomyces sp. NPDC017179]|uniref:hypothetical protein n=1 Tax=Streptomyces sp. NPDC017179 TaxID=3364979 RepID=UPI003797C804
MPLREGVGDPLPARLSLAEHLYADVQQLKQVPTLRGSEGVHLGRLLLHQGNDLIRALLLIFGFSEPASHTVTLGGQFVFLRPEGLFHLPYRVFVDAVSGALIQLVLNELGELL